MSNADNNNKKFKNGVTHRSRIGVSLPIELCKRVKDAAAADNRSLSNWLETAIKNMLEV